MNSSQFMDKQIMGLSGSQKDELYELLNPSEDQNINTSNDNGSTKKEEILPRYDFQPLRPAVAPNPVPSSEGARVWSSADSKAGTSYRNYSSVEPTESLRTPQEREREAYDKTTVIEIDRTMKKHADNLLHALETVSARLSQLESRTRHLENSVDDLKVSIGNNHGSTDGRLRQLENILKEIQTGVQVLRDKQEIAEAHTQLAKLQVPKQDHQIPEAPQATQTELLQHQPAPPPQHMQLAPQPLPLPALPPPNAPPPPQNPPVMPTTGLPPNQPPFYLPVQPQPEPQHQQYPPTVQQPEPPQVQYQMPPPQQPAPLQHHPVAPPQMLQAPPQMMQAPPGPPSGNAPPSYPPQQPPQQNPQYPPMSGAPVHHSEEAAPYMGPQNYPPNARMTQPPSGPPPSQQFYGATHGYEPNPNRTGSGQPLYTSGYTPSGGPNYGDSYSYGSPSRYDGPVKPSQIPPSAPSSGSGYPRLPTAQLLPQAVPMASSISSSSSSGSGSGPGGRVPIDDVVEKVATMGFSREQVRATVRKLTENGQSVDLNIVLDKLMNDSDIQPQRGWFNR